ncbi:MAG: C-GCAxxG-C-C family protein [Candidatus Hodarchaeales archaeon]|jgi:C_GCAxxG_C_C family probable redox protein
MKDQDVFNEVLTKAYKRMHRYTCAEASLQALLTLWDLPLEQHSWATGGYLGAIMSGKTTCGLLIGSSIAIGLYCGKGKKKIPEDHENDREKAIQAVGELYREFLDKFGSSDCKTINQIDFSKGEEIAEWMAERGWKQTCDVFLGFTIRKCADMVEEGKL